MRVTAFSFLFFSALLTCCGAQVMEFYSNISDNDDDDGGDILTRLHSDF